MYNSPVDKKPVEAGSLGGISYLILMSSLSRSYIKRFVWYNLYDSQSVFKFSLRLHSHTSCSYRVHKSCSYKLFSLQEFKEIGSRTSCSSSYYCIQGLKNCVHAGFRVRIVHAKALWRTWKNVYANYFSVKIISQLENYLYCFTKTFFAVQD